MRRRRPERWLAAALAPRVTGSAAVHVGARSDFGKIAIR
jgi:hypothetical protein